MEQRSLRLGDIVDDYCPRERRITNHAIVAIVEDAIRQTRCTTCDYEHVFKQAREPRRRQKPAESLYEQVLADVAGPRPVDGPEAALAARAPDEQAAPADQPAMPTDDVSEPVKHEEGWPAHRTLIRATLPRLAGEQPPPRPIPEFTMHQRPQAARGRANVRLAYGPQGDPFGQSRETRPARRPPAAGRGGETDGNGTPPEPGNGSGTPGKSRSRRRRGGKRSR